MLGTRRRIALSLLAVFTLSVSAACSDPIAPMDGHASDAALDMGPPPSGPPCGGGSNCTAGTACCLTTGRCFDPAIPTQCPAPADASVETCTSDVDCPTGTYCLPDERFPSCVGSGRCQSSTNCAFCSGPDCAVCSCDGQTYASTQDACHARARIAANGACGVGSYNSPDGGEGRAPRIGCGTNAQCPSGMSCCGLTSVCVPADCPECCVVPPPGSSGACRTSADCWRVIEYCGGTSCTGVGFCEQQPAPLQCDIGVLRPVCGCDGQTYQTECLARSHGTRIAHEGNC